MFKFNALEFFSVLLTLEIVATQDEILALLNPPDEMDNFSMTRFLLALEEICV